VATAMVLLRRGISNYGACQGVPSAAAESCTNTGEVTRHGPTPP
jgi:hypothetical protein